MIHPPLTPQRLQQLTSLTHREVGRRPGVDAEQIALDLWADETADTIVTLLDIHQAVRVAITSHTRRLRREEVYARLRAPFAEVGIDPASSTDELKIILQRLQLSRTETQFIYLKFYQTLPDTTIRQTMNLSSSALSTLKQELFTKIRRSIAQTLFREGDPQ